MICNENDCTCVSKNSFFCTFEALICKKNDCKGKIYFFVEPEEFISNMTDEWRLDDGLVRSYHNDLYKEKTLEGWTAYSMV